MTDVPPEYRPVPSEPDPHATRVLPPDQGPRPPRQRFIDRVWSFRALIAVALASVILGGLAGAAIANAGDSSDQGGPMRFHRGGPMGPPGSRQWRGPGNGPGPGLGNGPGNGTAPRWPGSPRGHAPAIPTPPTASP